MSESTAEDILDPAKEKIVPKIILFDAHLLDLDSFYPRDFLRAPSLIGARYQRLLWQRGIGAHRRNNEQNLHESAPRRTIHRNHIIL